MAAIAQLRPQAMGLIGQLADAGIVGDLRKAHRNAQAGGGGAPAARSQQDGVFTLQLSVHIPYGTSHGILHLLRQFQVRLHLHKHRIAHGDAGIAAHEIAPDPQQVLPHLGHHPRLPQAMGLQRPALQQVHPVVPVPAKAAGILHIHRVVVFFRQQGHESGHHRGKIRVPQQLAEAEQLRHRLAIEPQLPEAGGGGHIRLQKQAGIGLHIRFVQVLQPHGGKAVVFQVDQVHLVLGEFIFIAIGHHGRRQGFVQVDEPGIVIRLPIHGTGAHAEDQAQHSLVLRCWGAVFVQVPGVPHPRHMGIIIVAMAVAADPHHQQRHLLVPIHQVSLNAVLIGFLTQGAGIHGLYRRLELPVPLLDAALVRAEYAFILTGKGVAEAILQQGAGADNDG